MAGDAARSPPDTWEKCVSCGVELCWNKLHGKFNQHKELEDCVFALAEKVQWLQRRTMLAPKYRPGA
jgi:hypothetical protein